MGLIMLQQRLADYYRASDFREHKALRFSRSLSKCSLLMSKLATLWRVDHARSVYDNHVRAVAVLHSNVDLARVEGPGGVSFQPLVLELDVSLQDTMMRVDIAVC